MALNLRAAWKALFGGDAPKSAGGLLAGITPYGQAPRRGTRELLAAYRYMPWLRAVAHRVASDVASVPFRLYSSRRRGLKSWVRARGDMRRKLLDGAVATGDLREVETHPFLTLVDRMNPALGGMASRQVMQLHGDIKGESFLVKERNGAGLPVQLWPIPPHWVLEPPSATRPTYRCGYLGWHKMIPEEDILWLRSPDPENPYARGVGVAESLADELDIDEYAAKHIRNWFFNDGRPSGLVAIEDAGEAELERVEEDWRQKFSGPGKSGRLKFTNGKLSMVDLSHTFRDMELVALREHERDTIRQVFGVPPEVLGIIENSNRATIEASYYLYAKGVLCPRLDFLVAGLQPLAEEFDESLVVDYVSPVPEDAEFKKSVMVALPGNYTIDEHRALAGMEPLPSGGDSLYMPAAPSGPFGLMSVSADPPWAKSIRAKRDVSNNILEALRPERLTQETDPVWEERVKAWGDRVLAELGVAVRFDMRNPLVRDILASAGKKISGVVHETTRERLRSTLQDGVFAGEGIDELKRRVKDVFAEATNSRAEMIARTEVVGSSNQANVLAYEVSEVVEQKEWLAVRDGNTRQEHRDMDGQRVGVRAPFQTPMGQTAQHPGGFGVAELDVNCRCTALPVVTDPKHSRLAITKDATEEQKAAAWRAFDKALVPWEREAAEALRRGFRTQEEEVLAALERWA